MTIRCILFLFLLMMCSAVFAQIPAKPNPPRLVNDFTGTLTAEQIAALESKLVGLDDTTFTQIAVVLVNSTGGREISEYNLELGRAWGVGSEKNNGIVLLISKDDRKLDIATGYGLEGALTDATARDIIDNIIVPNFKGNDYYRGIDEGTDAIVRAVKGQYHTLRKKNYTGGARNGLGIAVFVIIMIVMFSGRSGRGGGGSFMSRRGGSTLANALFWSSMLGGSGRGGGGGGWSGGGGGSSGGFGGFGGGSFGGGGASGSW